MTATSEQAPAPMVSVREAAGTYSVAASFEVPQPARVVLAVLSDYQEIPRFMPDVRTSVVLERTPGRLVIEQEAVSQFMMFSKKVHLVLEVTETEDSIHFVDRCADSFTRYEGTWRAIEKIGGTTVTYDLTAHPAFDVPEFVLKRLLKRDSAEMISRLRREIAARARLAPTASTNNRQRCWRVSFPAQAFWRNCPCSLLSQSPTPSQPVSRQRTP